MCLYDVSKPTKLQLVREVKDGEAGEYRQLAIKIKTATPVDNLKMWLTSFFQSICDIMPMCENENGSTNRHLPSWFTKGIVLTENIKDMESKSRGNKYLHNPYPKFYKNRIVRENNIVAVMHNCGNNSFLKLSHDLSFSFFLSIFFFSLKLALIIVTCNEFYCRSYA